MKGRANRYILFTLWGMCLLAGNVKAQAQVEDTEPYFHWSVMAQLPAPAGREENPGVAGAFSGVHNDALIIAGGANFPDAAPWEGGKKVWWNTISVLSKKDSAWQWENTDAFALEKNAAYGASVSVPQGVFCAGGQNENGPLNDVFLLGWDPIGKKIINRKLGDLPPGFLTTGVFFASGNIYIAGIRDGQNQLLAINLETLLLGQATAASWKELEGCPGPPRQMAACAAQSNGRDMCLYLFSGRTEKDGKATVFADGYGYNIRTGQWTPIRNGIPAMGAPAMAYGTNHILLFGGDDGDLFLERSRLDARIRAASYEAEADSLNRLLTQSFTSHPGFSRQVYAYNTITGTFQRSGMLPPGPPVVTEAILWNNNVIIPSGEVKPGIRTPAILKGRINRKTGRFGALNYTILAVYFLVLILIGVFFSYRQRSTDDYFKGGGRVPWWAAGLSVFGTALSAITFVAIPAKTFATDWAYFFYNLSVLLTTPVVILLFIPFYRRLNVTTAYEYLEKRFNLVVRLFGSLSFMIFQVGRIAIVLYIPSIALSLVTGINIYYCIVVVGTLSIIYTLIGGIEAVIWTDVVQVIVLMGGAILSLVVIFTAIGHDIPAMTETGVLKGKFNLADFSFALNTPTIWVVLAGGFFANLVTYSTDQTLVQRYLTTRDERGAAKTAWTNALLVIPATLLFFSVGTALYLYYIKYPQRLDPFTQNNDAIFPWFIANDLPDGVSGLLIAGLFSAAMSSLSSSINSTGTAFTTDFYQRFKTGANHNLLKVARLSTLTAGILGTCFALWMAGTDIISLWDEFFKVLGLFTGGLGGVFLLGVCSTRANGTGAITGLVGSAVIQYLVSQYTGIHVFLYITTGLVSCVVIGYLASLVVTDSNIKGKELTIYNRQFRRKHEEQDQI